MSWTGAVNQMKSTISTAAAALTPAITVVRKGEPDALNVDTIALWPSGWRDSSTGGETLTRKNIERGVQVVIYLRGATRAGAIDDALEDRLVTVEEAIIGALMLDRDVGGNAIGLFIDSADYGWAEIAGQLARVSTFTAWVDLSETYSTSL